MLYSTCSSCVIDSVINHIRHFIKIPFINEGVEFIDLPSIFRDNYIFPEAYDYQPRRSHIPKRDISDYYPLRNVIFILLYRTFFLFAKKVCFFLNIEKIGPMSEIY